MVGCSAPTFRNDAVPRRGLADDLRQEALIPQGRFQFAKLAGVGFFVADIDQKGPTVFRPKAFGRRRLEPYSGGQDENRGANGRVIGQ